MSPTSSILFFSEIHLSDLDKVGGKNSSLGEMYNFLKPLGIHIPDGFAITARAYRQFIKENDLESALNQIINELDTKEYSNLSIVGEKSRALIYRTRRYSFSSTFRNWA
jgi:pyruvate,water dikinase